MAQDGGWDGRGVPPLPPLQLSLPSLPPLKFFDLMREGARLRWALGPGMASMDLRWAWARLGTRVRADAQAHMLANRVLVGCIASTAVQASTMPVGHLLTNHTLDSRWRGRKSSLLLSLDDEQCPLICIPCYGIPHSQNILLHSFRNFRKIRNQPPCVPELLQAIDRCPSGRYCSVAHCPPPRPVCKVRSTGSLAVSHCRMH
ncbi:hypothetical protein F4780DRAFT_272811 [Xylariomycetidae sp. FL0641]|nr:hypothetical protein F4780DRAFT_272811 [Xylariomycetidae sp. FL0641]